MAENFRAGGAWSYLRWESYTSEEDERRAQRLGLSRKETGLRLLSDSDGSIRGVAMQDDEIHRPSVLEALAMTEALRVRSVVHAYLELVSFE